MMRYTISVLAALVGAACAPVTGARSSAPASTTEGSATRIGRYELTRSELLGSTTRDSIYRYTDGTKSTISVIRYDVSEGAKIGVDSQAWTAREGEKFELVQSALVEQGRIESFRTAFSNTQELVVDGTVLREHSIAIAVRARGSVYMDFQYLYLVGGRFLKVRGTFPGESWKTSEIPNFAREIARRVHRSAP